MVVVMVRETDGYRYYNRFMGDGKMRKVGREREKKTQ